MDIEEEIRIVKWVVVVAVLLLTYGLQFAALNEKNENNTIEFLRQNFWTPEGQTRFLTIFVPIGLLFWFIDCVRAKRRHSFLWHIGTFLKIVLYVVVIFSIFSWFIGPLTYVTTEKQLEDYFWNTILSEHGVRKIVVLIVVTAVILLVDRFQSRETPRTPRDEY
jgi:hypothetical protein